MGIMKSQYYEPQNYQIDLTKQTMDFRAICHELLQF